MRLRASAMSALVTEPNRRPSTPAFCVMCTVRPLIFSPSACAVARRSAATFRSEGVGDVGVGDRAEQTPIDTGLLRDVHGPAAHLLAQRLRRCQAVGCDLLELDPLGLELLDRRGGGAARCVRRNEEVAGKAVLDLDDVAEVAEVGDLFQKNDLHGGGPQLLCWSVYGSIARNRARLMHVVSWRCCRTPTSTR